MLGVGPTLPVDGLVGLDLGLEMGVAFRIPENGGSPSALNEVGLDIHYPFLPGFGLSTVARLSIGPFWLPIWAQVIAVTFLVIITCQSSPL